MDFSSFRTNMVSGCVAIFRVNTVVSDKGQGEGGEGGGIHMTSFLTSAQKNVVGTHQNCLSEVLLTSTDNICFVVKYDKYQYFPFEKKNVLSGAMDFNPCPAE